MQLNEKQRMILEHLYQQKEYTSDENTINKQFKLSNSSIRANVKVLERWELVKAAWGYGVSEDGREGIIYVYLTDDGINAVENPKDLTQPNSVILMNNNTNNFYGSVNAPFSILQDADNNTVTINQNIDQNIAEVIKSLDFLQKEIQNFPENQKEIATVHLDDLREEITTEERRNPKKIKAYFMAFLGIALPLLGYVANTTDFINNLTDLGEKFNIEVPKLGEIIQESELTQEESVKLADEINQSAWRQLNPKTLK